MRLLLISLAVLASVPLTLAQSPSSGGVDISGVYRAVAMGTTLPGGLRNSGSLSDIELLPAAAAQLKDVDPTLDPDKQCQPVGPFRMMARDGTKIEIVMTPARGLMTMLFEDVSRGHIRTVRLNQPHPATINPSWHGHSVAKWEGDTLVVDTVGFNERTWLNAAGAQHTDKLRLVERIRPVLGGAYLEYRVTAEDPGALAKPYTYTRYYEKLKAEIGENVCES